MDDDKTTPEPTTPEDKQTAPLVALFNTMLDKRESSLLQSIEKQVASLGERKPPPEVREVLDDNGQPKAKPVERGNGGLISRNQPTDPLYRRMPEEVREYRNADTDYWMAQWIRGDSAKDPAVKALAAAKLDDVFGRADTLEGAAGADGAISDGTGGALLPRPLEAVVLIARDRVSKMRRFAMPVQMTRQTHTVPTIGAFTAYATAEAATATQGEGTIAEVQLTANKWQVKAIASREILEDTPYNLVSIYSQKAGSALGAFEEAQFWRTGNGTAPNASAFAAGTAYAETTSGALGFVDVSTMYYNVGQQYRGAGAWFADSDVLGMLHRVVDAVNGRPFYQGLMDGPRALTDDPDAVGTLLGKPVYEVDTTAGTIHFGDVSALYAVGSRAGIRSRTSEHALFTSDKVVWLWDERADGINVDTVAVQTATGITSATAAAS